MNFLGMLRAMKSSHAKYVLPAIVCLLMAACAQNPPAPVIDMTMTIPPAGVVGGVAASPAPAPMPEAVAAGHYVVAPGDTLYSIAFRNRLDWKDVAAWNAIGAPYTIVPGQDLRLTAPPPGTDTGVASTYGTGTVATTPIVVEPVAETTEPGSSPAPVEAPSSPPVATVDSGVAPSTPAVVAEPPATPAPAPVAAGPSRNVAGLDWRWPASGAVLNTFVASDPTRQGIDIGGRRGSPVQAAADGIVVYSGNGLVGYGELVIVKHSDTYLSAYGHNDKRLVQEGDRVRAGQDIATMGSSGTSRTGLHFEIRKRGQPIDPLGFLPKR